jgi:hypothetical protein
VFYFLAILCYSQSGDDLQEDVAKFGYKLNLKIFFVKNPSIFLAAYLNHVGAAKFTAASGAGF